MPQPDLAVLPRSATRCVARAVDSVLMLFGRLPRSLRLAVHLAIAGALVASCAAGTAWPLSVLRITAAFGYLAALERARILTASTSTRGAR